MQQRKLGEELHIAEIGYGAMGLSGVYGEADDKKSIALLQQANQWGVNFFDTADVYGNGHNERLLGKAFAKLRDKIIIASKCALKWDPQRPEVHEINNSPEYIKQACDASLQRLNTDYIDLYYLHRIDPTVAIEESIGALAELIKVGKIRYLGISEASAATIKRAHAVHPLTAVQTEYSLWSRDVEKNVEKDNVLATCRALNIGFVAYSPLGRGLLAGSIGRDHVYTGLDFRRNLPRYQDENVVSNLSLVERLKAMAKEKAVTPAQLALAWVLAQGKDIVPIPGTRNQVRLAENLAAAEINLTNDELKALSELFNAENIKGTRYPETLMRDIGQ